MRLDAIVYTFVGLLGAVCALDPLCESCVCVCVYVFMANFVCRFTCVYIDMHAYIHKCIHT